MPLTTKWPLIEVHARAALTLQERGTCTVLMAWHSALQGPCLAIGGDGSWRTSVARQTRDPVWQEDPPVMLRLKPAAMQDLAHRRLLVRGAHMRC